MGFSPEDICGSRREDPALNAPQVFLRIQEPEQAAENSI
jgi:hypothetical protein